MDKESVLKKVGVLIKEIRVEKGLSQRKLAHRINKDQQSIQRLEAGNINPSIFYLYEISKGLEISLKDFLIRMDF
ncbi:hypothetical protein KO02_19490 [Sphingobacterium sp. ML3W]|uniref:helix-turn-helix domain-containing protein n=1 Tax=Sphingobacterium sp. ML3W TaxID=1538644 RepID=UPI0004F61009|nr:helix-turn-helix transcriptional regulator [Sphingobacterium sp. ML3W]AIM38635.1 hypothetical protein KO02_19490 [Sphingobacterium sp. ML3W]